MIARATRLCSECGEKLPHHKETCQYIAGDPVHYHEGAWWFWTETWSDREGPYPTEQMARDGLNWYCENILGANTQG